jgi:ferredoxin
MEGYGPTNGTPRRIGLVMASADSFALDAVASEVIGLPQDKVPFLRRAAERGLWSGTVSDVEIAGEPVDAVRVPDFSKPAVRVAFNMYSHVIPKPILRHVNRHIKPRPVFRHDRCRGCRACAESCPAKAIEMRDRRPYVELRKCIRCYCCDELCNYDAVGIRRPWFIRLFVDRAAEEK